MTINKLVKRYINTKNETESVKFSVPLEKLRDVRSVYAYSLTENDLFGLITQYKRWLKESSYLCLYNTEKDEFLFVQSKKRGNDAYCYLLKERLDGALSWMDDKSITKDIVVRKKRHKYICNAFFLTLTFNPSHILNNLSYSWRTINYHYAKFITKLRQHFGKIYAIKTIQSHCNGYPHIHLVIITEKTFNVIYHFKSKSYRLKSYKELSEIKGLWSCGFLDIKGITAKTKQNNEDEYDVKNYIFKDLLKSHLRKDKYRDLKDDLTLSLNWLFRKRSFSISGRGVLNEILRSITKRTDLIITMTNLKVFDVDFSGYEYVGIITIHFEGKDPPFFAHFSGDFCRKNDIGLVFPEFKD